MEDKFVSSMPSQSFDKALEGGLKFYNGEFVSEEQKQALTGPQGPQGKRGTGILKVTTEPKDVTGTVWLWFSRSKVLSESGASEVLVGDIIQHESNHYLVDEVTSSVVYIRTVPTSIKGDPGPAYTLTDTDKKTIAEAVKASLTTETWTFTLEDDTTVTKKVLVSG